MGASLSHVYNTPGTYTTELTVTDNTGAIYSSQRNVYVFASIDNSNAIVPSNVLFFDNFDYAVGREDTNAVQIFQNQGGWTNAKTQQTSGCCNGYLYTVDRIPGYNGPFPGSNSNRVLVLESLPSTFGYEQTDYYLQFGEETSSLETVPGDVWFQFWIYPNYYDDPNNLEDQLSGFSGRSKFIYPCRTWYPCDISQTNWLYTIGGGSDQPYADLIADPSHSIYMQFNDHDIDYTNASFPGGNWKLGQTNISEKMEANRWTLVKLHMNTSTSSGSWEAWLKPMGGQWVKVAEWFDGQDGLNWTVPVPGGHRMFRMPTTITQGNEPTASYDSWIYMDDFAMAGSEDALPVYPY